MRRDLLIGVLLVAVGAAGATWQIEASAGGATRPLLVCPLGAHGLEPQAPTWVSPPRVPAR